jgi:hypothetical protein
MSEKKFVRFVDAPPQVIYYQNYHTMEDVETKNDQSCKEYKKCYLISCIFCCMGVICIGLVLFYLKWNQ